MNWIFSWKEKSWIKQSTARNKDTIIFVVVAFSFFKYNDIILTTTRTVKWNMTGAVCNLGILKTRDKTSWRADGYKHKSDRLTEHLTLILCVIFFCSTCSRLDRSSLASEVEMPYTFTRQSKKQCSKLREQKLFLPPCACHPLFFLVLVKNKTHLCGSVCWYHTSVHLDTSHPWMKCIFCLRAHYLDNDIHISSHLQCFITALWALSLYRSISP